MNRPPNAMAQIAALAGVDTPPPTLGPARKSRKPGGINLRAVAEVLKARGFDPTEEILDILDDVDAQGRPVLDSDTRARIHLELLQYVQPKLKSIEIRAKVAATAFDINDAQAKRIAEEFLKIGNAESDGKA